MIFENDKICRKGIIKNHLDAIIQTAREKNVAIGVRSVNPNAMPWIEKGFPTKSFVIKNKTALSGPCQGLIAAEGKHGRLNSQLDQDTEIVAYEKKIQYALTADATLKKIPLTYSLNDLQHLNGVTLSHTQQNIQLEWKQEDKTQIAIAVPNGENFDIYDEAGDPIHVLGKQIVNAQGNSEYKPITADYDLLVVSPAYRDLETGRSSPDHAPLRTQSFDKKSLQKLLEKEKNSVSEDPLGGNWTPRIRNVVYTINENIKAHDGNRNEDTQGLETMHHNAEFNNPYADPLSKSLPATIIFPKTMDLTSLFPEKAQNTNLQHVDCVMAETVEELNLIRSFLKQQGYYWPSHANLKEDIPVFEPEVVEVSERFIQQRRQKETLQQFRTDKKIEMESKPIDNKNINKESIESSERSVKGK